MLKKIEQFSKILNESYGERSLISVFNVFFKENFGVEKVNLYLNRDKMKEEIEPNNGLFRYSLYKRSLLLATLEFSNTSKQLEDFLNIVSDFISIKIQNILLNEKMQKNIDFHETMKNIAKIIETQYELNYVIPIIGEMLDKFFTDYLTYIFLYDENFKQESLAWPSACNDNKIIQMIKNNSGKVLSTDNKIYLLPLVSEAKKVGYLVAKSTGDEISFKDMDYLEQLSVQIATTINRANVYAEILKHATLDALTGFYNRRQLEERIGAEVSNAKRQKAPLCGIMTDIDFFKHVNDTYGHAVGDLVLQTIAKIIRSQLREYDIAGRYGGEEFSILLPFTKIEEAQMVAERLRQTIEDRIIDISKVNPEAEQKKIKVTLSLGVYEMKEDDNDDDLLKKADKALYKAKNTGRNKVVVNYD